MKRRLVDLDKRYNRWYADTAFAFPWIYRSDIGKIWYFEMVIFHQCINFKLSRTW